ncbi:MAG TPA: FRG domain-containing protein [Thermomicrobiales bacterium]|jgi:hypothetical protein|nr:FRG domain-containing protein [Thermomicrobiales bacterium]
MAIREVASSWLELQQLLFDYPPDPHLNRFRSNLVYRGVPTTAARQMATGLMRLGGDYAAKEKHLIRNFRKYALHDVNAGDSVWHWLAIGQHYGLPTRLLDWTFSPYTALHFATSDLALMDDDAIVWCVDREETGRYLPAELSQILRKEGAHLFTAEMLEEASRRIEDFDTLPGDFVVWLEPPALDSRIVNQYALFSLMSSPTALLDEWLDANSVTAREIIIPAELKWEVRDKLDQANITERIIYPGLGGLSAWLKRHYYTR